MFEDIVERIEKFMKSESGKKLKELLEIICKPPDPPVIILKDYPKKE